MFKRALISIALSFLVSISALADAHLEKGHYLVRGKAQLKDGKLLLFINPNTLNELEVVLDVDSETSSLFRKLKSVNVEACAEVLMAASPVQPASGVIKKIRVLAAAEPMISYPLSSLSPCVNQSVCEGFGTKLDPAIFGATIPKQKSS